MTYGMGKTANCSASLNTICEKQRLVNGTASFCVACVHISNRFRRSEFSDSLNSSRNSNTLSLERAVAHGARGTVATAPHCIIRTSQISVQCNNDAVQITVLLFYEWPAVIGIPDRPVTEFISGCAR